jgi:DNA polymerase III subunit alpha
LGFKVWSTGSIEEILQSITPSPNKEKRRVVIAGLISELREVITKKGTRMAFGKIEDLTGQMEVIFFPDTFAVYEALIKSEKPLLLGGNLESENGAGKVIVDTASTIEGVFSKTKKVILHLDRLNPENYDELYSILMEYEGNVPVELQVFVADLNRRVVLQNSQLKGLQIDSELFEKIQSQIGQTNFFEIQMGS